jgi:polysaccharide biosynthesis PFTS motif protein
MNIFRYNRIPTQIIAAGKSFWQRRARSRIRNLLRGGIRLRCEGRPFAVVEATGGLTDVPLGVDVLQISPRLVGDHSAHADFLLRQLMLEKAVGRAWLGKAMAFVGGKRKPIIHPLPKSWIADLERRGYRFNRIGCRLALGWLALGSFIHGLAAYGRRLTSYRATMAEDSQSAHVSFGALTEASLPSRDALGPSSDLISWYRRSALFDAEGPEVRAEIMNLGTRWERRSPGLVVNNSMLPPLPNLGAAMRFAWQGLLCILTAVADLLRGRWWSGVLLREAILLHYVRNLPVSALARAYYFNNSSWILRPLWTYEAERSGSRIAMIFYSTNNDRFCVRGHWTPVSAGMTIMTWPTFVVWDEYQTDLLRTFCPRAEFEIVGSVPLSDGSDEVVPRADIAMFDVTAFRPVLLASLGVPMVYYDAPIVEAFLEDVISSANELGLTVAWKSKRDVGRAAHPRYRAKQMQIASAGDVRLIPPEVNALRVIDNTRVVISMPFTSTAIVAAILGKPSAYYDPTGELEFLPRAAHGLSVLRTRDELLAWLREYAVRADGEPVASSSVTPRHDPNLGITALPEMLQSADSRPRWR